MYTFIASYRNELDKLISRKKYIVFIIIGLSICLIWTAIGQLISGFALRQGGIALSLTPSPMGALPLFLHIIIPFLMFMGITDLVTIESADNTMKSMICRPVERWKLYATKILAVETYAAVYLLVVYIICAVLNQIFGRTLSIQNLLVALASYALTLIPLAILACYSALLAVLGKSGSLTMLILLLSYIMLMALPVIFPQLSEMLFTSYLSWYRLWIGAIPVAAKMVHMLLIVGGYGIVFYTAGSLLFDRKGY